MKKISSKIIISLLLAVTLWSGVGFVSAEETTTVNIDPNLPNIDNGLYVVPTNMSGVTSQPQNSNPPAGTISQGFDSNNQAIVGTQQVNGEATEAVAPVEGETKTTFWGMMKGGLQTFAKGTAKIVQDAIGYTFQIFLVPTLGILVRICGFILDTSVTFTLDSANLGTNGSGIGDAIAEVWSIVRNIFNITFIFILLYAAIKTIIGSASANTKKTIANVIIAALLINFSLFITRIVIDAGNILGTELYNLIKVGSGDVGIGTIMMNKMGLSGLWNFQEANQGNILAISVLQIILLSTTIIVFLYAALLMISRTVSLIFIMVMSPLGFMGDVVPSLSEYAKMWRTNLFGQVSIAPIFLLFIYLIVQVSSQLSASIGSIVDKTNTNVLNQADIIAKDDPTQYIAYLKYVMIIMLLIIAVKIVKKQSGVIGGAMEKFGGMAAGAALGIATGGAALAMRQTIGRSSANALEGDKGADLRARAAAGDKGARIQLAYHEKASKSSFDARNTKAAGMAGTALGNIGGQLGVKVPGAGKAGGLASSVGLGGTVAEARKVQQEAENKKFNELNASVTNKQKLDANAAIQARDARVKTILSTNTQHNTAKRNKDDLLNVDTQMPTNAEWTNAKQEQIDANNELTRVTATGNAKDIAEAKRNLAAAERTKKAKEKELQEELKKKYVGEIAELDEEMKKIKMQTEVSVEQGMSTGDRRKMNIVNQGRNYASSVRKGRFGHGGLSGQIRRDQLADNMQNQQRS